MTLGNFIDNVSVIGTVVISVVSDGLDEVERHTIHVYEPLKRSDIYMLRNEDRKLLHISDYEDLPVQQVSAWENGVGLVVELLQN
jgi:hypothetical protein